MENVKIDKEKVDLLSANAPLIYVGYQRNPKSVDADGWLREGEELPDDAFRVMIRQRFPIVRGDGVIDSITSSYYIYVGRKVSVSSLLENTDLLRDDVKEALMDSLKLGIESVVVADVGSRFNDEDKVYMYPMLKGDFQVDSCEALEEVVKTIVGLHGELIQKPSNESIKTFRKTL